VTLAPTLWAGPGEGPEGCWSVAVDTAALRSRGNGWQTPYYNEFIIYELHPLRFSRRTPGAVAFDQLSREVAPDGYLGRLGVTALELLPTHEFPKEISWGYNPSCFFAIESSYGGPAELARMVEDCHRNGKAVMLDLVFNHLVESPMQEIAADVFADGETQWGDMVNYDHSVCIEFFRQAYIYLWDTFHLDGFRFDATEAIVNGHVDNGYIVRDHRTGSGHGWEFLVELKRAIEQAANASGRHWPFRVCENDPCNEGMLGRCMDAEWDFWLQYPLGECACNREDKTDSVRGVLQTGRPLHQVVRYAESHDAVSAQDGWKQRMATREAWGSGLSMAKAMGATVLLAEGVPMLFMGQEAAEIQPFYFGMQGLDDSCCYLDLDRYLDPGTPHYQVLRWFQHLIGLRRNLSNGFAYDDEPIVGRGYKTLAFTRAGGRFFVIVTFGTSDTRQNLGHLGLPGWGSYKEIFNSTWDSYRVPGDSLVGNGGYSAALNAGQTVQLPPIGAVVLERN
jgi:1,4-alpha-glucan branching enzyme